MTSRTGSFSSSLQLNLTGKKIRIKKPRHPDQKNIFKSLSQGNLRAVQKIIHSGTSPNSKDKRGTTLLMLAARKNKIEILKYLLRLSDIEIDAQDKQGYTALMHAAEKGHLKAVAVLLTKEARVELQNRSGNTALILCCLGPPYPQICTAPQQHKIAKALLSSGANPLKQSNNGYSALKWCVKLNQKLLTRLFMGNLYGHLSSD